jgi:hypothetical protein
MSWWERKSKSSLDDLADAMWSRIYKRVNEAMNSKVLAKCPCGGLILSNGHVIYLSWPDERSFIHLPTCNKCKREVKFMFTLEERRTTERKGK